MNTDLLELKRPCASCRYTSGLRRFELESKTDAPIGLLLNFRQFADENELQTGKNFFFYQDETCLPVLFHYFEYHLRQTETSYYFSVGISIFLNAIRNYEYFLVFFFQKIYKLGEKLC